MELWCLHRDRVVRRSAGGYLPLISIATESVISRCRKITSGWGWLSIIVTDCQFDKFVVSVAGNPSGMTAADFRAGGGLDLAFISGGQGGYVGSVSVLVSSIR